MDYILVKNPLKYFKKKLNKIPMKGDYNMKYVKAIPPTDKNLSEMLVSNNWTKLKEPSKLGMAIIISLPFMFLNGFIELFILYYLCEPFQLLTRNRKGFNIEFTINLWTLLFIFGIIVFMTIHEFLHACFIPKFLSSEKTYWGINGICGFVFTQEKLKKERFLLISIMPFVILSIILPFILKIFGVLNGYTAFLCLINAMGSCVDMLNIWLVGIQVPKGATIINNGFETYFK